MGQDVVVALGIALVVVLVLTLALTALWRRAVRIDRAHLAVLAARRTLEAQLDRRAAATRSLVATGVLDPSAAVLLADVAHRAADGAVEPVVDDGLDGPRPGGDDAPTGASRTLTESELSRTLRAVLDTEVRDDLAADPRSRAALGELDSAWYRVEVARRFHDTRVVQARQARAGWAARTFHLAGRAPVPRTADMDTDHVEGAGA